MRAHVGGELPVFRGYGSQYGAGLGNVLGGIIRSAIPIVAPMVKSLGKSLVRKGADKLISVLDQKIPTPSSPDAPVHKRRKHTHFASVKRRRRRKADILSP